MYVEAIKKRTSIRTYTDKQIPAEVLEEVKEIIKDTQNPFGAGVRFCLLEGRQRAWKAWDLRFHKRQKHYVAGCLERSAKDLEGYGYAFEKAILRLTDLGLGTCWLGGTFKRSSFNKSAELKDSEILPAVTPIGYPSGKRSLMERTVAMGAGARTRKGFEELFFDGDFTLPLKTDDYKLKTCLEMVRIGPSASNKQPWRAVKQNGAVHFYLAETKGYAGNSSFGFKMQRIDLGIATCHIDMTAKELGIQGKITVNDPGIPSEYVYSFSWEEE